MAFRPWNGLRLDFLHRELHFLSPLLNWNGKRFICPGARHLLRPKHSDTDCASGVLSHLSSLRRYFLSFMLAISCHFFHVLAGAEGWEPMHPLDRCRQHLFRGLARPLRRNRPQSRLIHMDLYGFIGQEIANDVGFQRGWALDVPGDLLLAEEKAFKFLQDLYCTAPPV